MQIKGLQPLQLASAAGVFWMTLVLATLIHSSESSAERKVNIPVADEFPLAPSLIIYTLGVDFYSGVPHETAVLGPRVIVAAWDDGTVVWSEDTIKGGTTYFLSKIEPELVAATVSEICQKKSSIPSEYRTDYRGPDSAWTTMAIKDETCSMYWRTWHELWESTGKHVCIDGFIRSLAPDETVADMHEEHGSIEYLAFVETWTDMKDAALGLVPTDLEAEEVTLTFRGKLTPMVLEP